MTTVLSTLFYYVTFYFYFHFSVSFFTPSFSIISSYILHSSSFIIFIIIYFNCHHFDCPGSLFFTQIGIHGAKSTTFITLTTLSLNLNLILIYSFVLSFFDWWCAFQCITKLPLRSILACSVEHYGPLTFLLLPFLFFPRLLLLLVLLLLVLLISFLSHIILILFLLLLLLLIFLLLVPFLLLLLPHILILLLHLVWLLLLLVLIIPGTPHLLHIIITIFIIIMNA